jgi:hypothetical protein
MSWTESNTAPSSLIATKWLNDTPALGVVRQRPLCPYPSVAQYLGEGDVNEASSWECAELPFKVPVGNETELATVSVTVTQVQVETRTVTASWSWPWQWQGQGQGGRPTSCW